MDADEHKAFAQKYGVTGFPTIKIFTGSKQSPYQGQRNAEAFVDAALKAAKEKAYDNLGKKGSSSDKVNALKSLNSLLKSYKPILRTTQTLTVVNSSSLFGEDNENTTLNHITQSYDITQGSKQQSNFPNASQPIDEVSSIAPVSYRKVKFLKSLRSMLEKYKTKQ